MDPKVKQLVVDISSGHVNSDVNQYNIRHSLPKYNRLSEYHKHMTKTRTTKENVSIYFTKEMMMTSCLL